MTLSNVVVMSAAAPMFPASTRELLPVISIEGLNVRTCQKMRDRLQQAFTAYVEKYVAARRETAASRYN